GDANVQPELDVSVQLLALAGEAVRHGSLHLVRAQDLRKARMRIARVQKERSSELNTELELGDEPFLLVRMRRVVAVEVEPALPDRDHARMLRQLAQLPDGGGTAVARVMRMHAGRRVELQAIGDLRRQPALEHRGAGHYDVRHVCRPGAGGDRLDVDG